MTRCAVAGGLRVAVDNTGAAPELPRGASVTAVAMCARHTETPDMETPDETTEIATDWTLLEANFEANNWNEDTDG